MTFEVLLRISRAPLSGTPNEEFKKVTVPPCFVTTTLLANGVTTGVDLRVGVDLLVAISAYLSVSGRCHTRRRTLLSQGRIERERHTYVAGPILDQDWVHKQSPPQRRQTLYVCRAAVHRRSCAIDRAMT